MNCSEIELAEIDKTKNSSKTYSLDMADCPTPPIRHPPDTVKRRANDFKFVAFYPICSDGGDAVGYGDDCDWRNGKRIINHGGHSRNSENGAKAKKKLRKNSENSLSNLKYIVHSRKKQVNQRISRVLEKFFFAFFAVS
uniref:Uncharacterized protein n=1 Tax=Caenorhabditis japonica TaxID=281687 RepID=A0A8R1IUS0_CAEJA